ncbi:hypothetical protein ACXR0O_23470 [Verrucomicrobiota bacterium sgz303538]
MKLSLLQFATIGIAFLFFCSVCILVIAGRADFMLIGSWTFNPLTLAKFFAALLVTLFYLQQLFLQNQASKAPLGIPGSLPQSTTLSGNPKQAER